MAAELEFPCVLGSKLSTPLPDGLVGDDSSAFRQESLDVAEAQGESMVQPNAKADDFAREPVTTVTIRIRFHPRSLAGTGSS